MLKRRRRRRLPLSPSPSDPRSAAGGRIEVEGDSVTIDPTAAILLEGVAAAQVRTKHRTDQPVEEVVLALQLGGRVNGAEDHVDHLYLLKAEGAALIIANIVQVAKAAGPEFERLLRAGLEDGSP